MLVSADDAELRDVALANLHLFSVAWPRQQRDVRVHFERRTQNVAPRGTFLQCARMNVDRTGDAFVAGTMSGIAARGQCGDGADAWHVAVPRIVFDEPAIGDVEDVLALALTVGWRSLGWVPVHAAAVERDGRCLILCAPSGGGKSTMTTALMRCGWRTLGDDKLLLRADGAQPQLAALLATFNLHPQTNRWFAELGALDELDRYSAWTEKRRVSAERIAAGAVAHAAIPTHVVRLSRSAGSGISVRAMQPCDVLPVLLGQVVVPTDASVARALLGTLARTCASLRGLEVTVGDDAYAQPHWQRDLEEALA